MRETVMSISGAGVLKLLRDSDDEIQLAESIFPRGGHCGVHKPRLVVDPRDLPETFPFRNYKHEILTDVNGASLVAFSLEGQEGNTTRVTISATEPFTEPEGTRSVRRLWDLHRSGIHTINATDATVSCRVVLSGGCLSSSTPVRGHWRLGSQPVDPFHDRLAVALSDPNVAVKVDYGYEAPDRVPEVNFDPMASRPIRFSITHLPSKAGPDRKPHWKMIEALLPPHGSEGEGNPDAAIAWPSRRDDEATEPQQVCPYVRLESLVGKDQ